MCTSGLTYVGSMLRKGCKEMAAEKAKQKFSAFAKWLVSVAQKLFHGIYPALAHCLKALPSNTLKCGVTLLCHGCSRTQDRTQAAMRLGSLTARPCSVINPLGAPLFFSYKGTSQSKSWPTCRDLFFLLPGISRPILDAVSSSHGARIFRVSLLF